MKVSPARAGPGQVEAGLRAVIEAEVVVALLAVAAAGQVLGVAAGHIGADAHPVADLERCDGGTGLHDLSHVLVAEIGLGAARDGLEGRVCAGGSLEKAHVRAADTAGDVLHTYPVIRRKGRIRDVLFEFHRVDAGEQKALRRLEACGGLGRHHAGDVLVEINRLHAKSSFSHADGVRISWMTLRKCSRV